MTEKHPTTGLALLREPFPAHQISKLPKPTRQQTDAVRQDFKQGIRCSECGMWHHPKVVHLDYVGHAALTDRLLDCDPEWSWAPLALTPEGLPQFDAGGGLWIKLTVCGVERLGYGHAGDKQGGDAIKEVIGDALRNAAMRFGAALDLWHKGDLHGDGDANGQQATSPAGDSQREPEEPQRNAVDIRNGLLKAISGRKNLAEMHKLFESEKYRSAMAWLRDNDELKANEIAHAATQRELALDREAG